MLARAGFLAALMIAAFTAQLARAQDAPPAIIVIDQERLFQESRLGERIAQDLEERSAALAAENRAIEAELIAEERDLTERRAELEPEEFRALADAFDEKVDRLRAEQDAKTRELVAIRDAGRQNFTRSVGPILLEYMRQTGASVMLDRRSVVATADRVDVTDELIAEVDERVGNGGDVLSAEPQGGGAPFGPQEEPLPPPGSEAPPLAMPEVEEPSVVPGIAGPDAAPEAAE